MSESIAGTLHDIFCRCLFGAGESTEGAIMVDGVTANFGFHPGRVAESRDEIRRFARTIVSDDFTTGGGASFLMLCMARDGSQWGEHRNVQEFVCLSIACGIAKYCAPRPLWAILPGGMPYVAFDLNIGEKAEG